MPFRDIIGHRKLIALLSRSIDREVLPPSLIFSGPAGVGKRLVANAVAQAVNCRDPQRESSAQGGSPIPYDACGVCSACRRIARGIHPDVVVIEPGDNGSIKIEPVRDLIDQAGYRPFEGRRRAAIVDDAEAMVNTAQNALLKTLEEPPSASMFMLVTAHPDLLLPTVRSRCPCLRFQPLGPEDVARALVAHGRSEAEARASAATADGSIGRALAAGDVDLVQAREAAMRVLVQVASGDDPRRRIESAQGLLVKSGGGGASDREQLATHLRVMASLIRDAGLIGTGAERADLANRDLEPALARLTAFQGDRCVRAFNAVDRGLAALERNAGVKIVADWVSLNL